VPGPVVEGAPTEEPRPDASNAKIQRPATRATTGVSRALACMCVETPVVAHRRFTPPRSSSILCLWVRVHKYIPGRQVNAVWGRYPAVCRMCDVCKTIWSSLGARRQKKSAFESRKPCVPVVTKSFQGPQPSSDKEGVAAEQGPRQTALIR
jgi:hypothetical protein